MTFADRLFLSRVGSEYMNAALSGGITQMMILTFFTGTISYATALVAQNLGAERVDNCAKVLTQAGIIACVSAPMSLIKFLPINFGLWGNRSIRAAQKFTLTY